MIGGINIIDAVLWTLIVIFIVLGLLDLFRRGRH
jgi:hypothetical protein